MAEDEERNGCLVFGMTLHGMTMYLLNDEMRTITSSTSYHAQW